MTLPPEDRDLIARVLGVSAFNAPHTMYSFEDVEALLAAARSQAAPVVDDEAVERALDRYNLVAARETRSPRIDDMRAMRAALEAALTQPNGGQRDD